MKGPQRSPKIPQDPKRSPKIPLDHQGSPPKKLPHDPLRSQKIPKDPPRSLKIPQSIKYARKSGALRGHLKKVACATCHMSFVTCHIWHDTCHQHLSLSPVTSHLSYVKCHLSTSTDPSCVNSPLMHSRMFQTTQKTFHRNQIYVYKMYSNF